MEIYNSQLKTLLDSANSEGGVLGAWKLNMLQHAAKLWKLPNSGIHHNPVVYGTGFLMGVKPKGLKIGIEKAF